MKAPNKNNSINFKNILERIEVNNIELDNDSFSNNSHMNSFSFLPNNINLQSINSIKDNNSYKIEISINLILQKKFLIVMIIIFLSLKK